MRNFKFWAIASVCAALSIPLGHVVASGIQALATVPAGGTGLQTLTSGGVLLGAGTSPVTFATSADNTQALCGGNPPAFGVSCKSTAGSGGGITVYSGSALTVTAATYYFPVGGGALPSTTEANVDVEAPSPATLANFYVQMSVAFGTGNSGVFTWRKAGSSQSLTCTISGVSATTCSDVTHSFNVAQGDLIDVQLVTTGTIVVMPNIVMAVQFGTTGSNGTVNAGTSGQLGYYAASGTAISGGPPASSIVNAFSGCSGTLALLANGACGTSGTTPGYGPIASLPGSCSTNGLQYITTDSPYIFVCNGATYDATVFGYKVVQPNLSNFTALNAGTTDTTHGGIIAYGARGGSGAFYDIAVPGSGAYYIDMAYTASGTDSDLYPNGNFSFVILPTSSATAACRYLGLGSLGSGAQTQAFEVSTTNCTTAAGFASSNINLYSLATAPMIWVRMTDDGTTNRTFQVSTNPYHFNTLVTEGRTTQFTTGFVAFAVQLFQLAQSIHILHFNTCTGAPSAACY